FKSDIKRLNGEVYLFESKEIWAVILQSTFGMSDVSQLSFVCSLHSTRLIEHSIDHKNTWDGLRVFVTILLDTYCKFFLQWFFELYETAGHSVLAYYFYHKGDRASPTIIHVSF
uniref:Uncharacterized protein n=1 Tax=Amphimedon queenslandica TaxID=400682 RepID=A0A1X7TTM3_AMPQE